MWDAVCAVTSREYADSYLSQAYFQGGTLTPHTVTGWKRLTENRYAMGALTRYGAKLIKPPYHQGSEQPFQ
jgi:hypothetical protein